MRERERKKERDSKRMKVRERVKEMNVVIENKLSMVTSRVLTSIYQD